MKYKKERLQADELLQLLYSSKALSSMSLLSHLEPVLQISI